MSVTNIIDNRSDDRVTKCDAVYEVDRSDWEGHGLKRESSDLTEWLADYSVYDIIFKGMQLRGNVTVYLYDNGGIEKESHPDLKDHQIDLAKLSKTRHLSVL